MGARQPAFEKTTCCYCGVGCGLLVRRDGKGRISVEGDPDHPVNRGMLCSKGMNLHHTANDTRDRILYPLMRSGKEAPLGRTTWEGALDLVADRFRRAIETHGADSVAFYVSGQCLTEEYYILNKVMKGFIGSNNIDTNSRLCMSSAVAGYKATLGEDSVPGCYEDIELADCWLVAGANPAYCHPILFRRLEARRAQENPGRLIVADPRKTQTAAGADLHLALKPGTDVVLFQALGRLLWEGGWADRSFIEDHGENLEGYLKIILARSLEESATICGLDPADLQKAARWIGESRGFVSLWAMGLNQSQVGTDKNVALIDLHLLTGRIGKPGNAPFSLTGQPNAMGGREVGGLANLLGAHRNLTNPLHREEVARLWGSPPLSPRPGLTATELVDAALDGRLKALWVVCTNPLVSFPDLDRAEKAFSQIPFLVVQDVSEKSDTLRFADVVLPAATWAEKEGTMTNSERRISYLSPVIPPPGEALADLEILRRFALKMGWEKAFASANAETLFQEHAQLTAGTSLDLSGLDYPRLKREGSFQWPVPSTSSAGTPRLFTDGIFSRSGNRARLGAPEYRPSLPEPDQEFPLILTTGRIRDQWHTMTRTGKVNRLGRHEPQPFLEIHPQDADLRSIQDGRLVVVRSARGEVTVRARVTQDIRPGVVFLPMHWGRIQDNPSARANNLTEPRPDPVSQEPDLKYQPVQVALKPAFSGRVLVVGAGPAALSFLRTWTEDNPGSQVQVLCAEPQAFYNRTLLPQWIEGTKSLDQLSALSPGEGSGWELKTPCRAAVLDRYTKTVTDSQGQSYGYDLLVIATGSTPLIPQVPGSHLRGVLGLRTIQDAQQILGRAPGGTVVVGGGLLAVEAAGALKAAGYPVTLVHRSQRLMDRQLDPEASQMLGKTLEEKSWDLRLGEEVEEILGGPQVTAVRLKSGTILNCSCVLFALGTQPRIDWITDRSLARGRALTVDSRLRTSDPSILALGEAAEFESQVFGFTPACEEQGRIAALAASGDPAAHYRGTPGVNILKVEGLELAVAGTAKEAGEGVETIDFRDPSLGIYKKLLVRNDRLEGVILLGDKGGFSQLKEKIFSGEELGAQRRTLLGGGPSSVGGTGKLVCSCMDVRQSTLEGKIRSGCGTVAALMEATAAGTGCGSCRPELKQILDKTLASVGGGPHGT